METKRRTSDLREEYFNQFRALQLKHRDDSSDFYVIALLLVFFIDYIEWGNAYKYDLIAPIVTKMENVYEPKKVAKHIDDAIRVKGKYAEELISFKKYHKETLTSIKNIIPYFPPNINIEGQSRRLKDMREESEVIAKGNQTNLALNKYLLNKRRKQWNTQRDNKVRRTTFHRRIDGQTVDIDDYFRVEGYRARFPSDRENLPEFDVYGCRCYLTYLD